MMRNTNRAGQVAMAMAAGVLLVAGGLWLVVLAVRQPLEMRLARFPWPVVCSVRGCITTVSWQQQWAARQAFAQASGEVPPAPAEALTTLARQHLVHHAFLRTPVGLADATRYRTEVLGLTDEATVRETVGLSLVAYDEYVLLPLLEQEALRSERGVESLDELFGMLARERWVGALPFHLKWNKDTARVEER